MALISERIQIYKKLLKIYAVYDFSPAQYTPSTILPVHVIQVYHTSDGPIVVIFYNNTWATRDGGVAMATRNESLQLKSTLKMTTKRSLHTGPSFPASSASPPDSAPLNTTTIAHPHLRAAHSSTHRRPTGAGSPRATSRSASAANGIRPEHASTRTRLASTPSRTANNRRPHLGAAMHLRYAGVFTQGGPRRRHVLS